MAVIKKDLIPGVRVRTPRGLAWVNFPPGASAAHPGNMPGKVFVRLGDNSTVWIDECDAIPVDF